MKKAFIALLFIGLFALGLVGSCGFSGYKFTRDFLANSLKGDGWNIKIFQLCYSSLPFIDSLDQVLNNQTYLLLLQNNREIRPTGGFIGSYARVHLQPTGLDGFEVQDIYVPDGQIAGHVDPPLPIQQAFGQGWWKLRDSNWDPDFTVAAPQIAWFFDQGGEEKVDGIVAVNLSLVNSLLEVLGEIDPVDYQEKVSAKTFYDLAQKYAEVGFFPGSTQKRDFLGAVGNALMRRIIISTPLEKLKIAKVVWQQLKQGEVLVWLKNDSLQKAVIQQGWGGGLGDFDNDYLYIVETNLGTNKANCCIDRNVVQDITGEQTKLSIDYQNHNEFAQPKPPVFWGGDYLNYLRVIIPAGSDVKMVKFAGNELVEKPLDNQYGLQEDRYQMEDRGKFKILGLWVVVPAGSGLTAEVQYSYGRLKNGIVVKKQPGIEKFSYLLIVDGKEVVSDKIGHDQEYAWTK